MQFILLLLFQLQSADALDVGTNYQYLWDYRDQNDNTDTALTTLNSMKETAPNDYEVHWNLARFYYWSASSSTDSERTAILAKKGLEAAEEAKRIKPTAIEGWYWATANIGIYADAGGTFITVTENLSSRYKVNAEKAISIDPLYDDGGPYRSLGIYYTKLPWPLQDLQKAEELIGRSMKENPNRALSLYHYAEIQIKSGDSTGGKNTLQKILSLDPEKGNAPEIRRYKPQAEERLHSIE